MSSLPLQRHPIRHENQVYGLLHNLKEEHAFTRSTNPQEPLLTHARNGNPCKFDPLWYPELIRMTEESLDSIDFGPETIFRFVLHKFTLRNCLRHLKTPPATHPRIGGVIGSCDRKWG